MRNFISNSGWSLLSQSIRVLTQAGLFVLLARGFGVDDFGTYITIFSISQLFYPLSGLGTHNTLVMRVSRAPQLLKYYYLTPVLSVLVVGFILVSTLLYVIDSIYTVSTYIIFSMLLTELVAYRLLDVATHAWQAVEKLKKVAISYLLISVLRVLLAGSLMLVGNLDITLWAISNVILTSVFALLLNYILIKKDLSCKVKWRIYYKEFFRSIYFSCSGVSQALNTNADKVILSRMVSSADLGAYSASYRVVQMALLPVTALFQASYPKYFKYGRRGIHSSLSFSKLIAPVVIGYSFIAMFFLIFLSEYLPLVLGEEYKDSVLYIQFMSPLIIIQALHFLIGEAMTGAGYQRERAFSQIATGVFGVLIGLIFIYIFGTFGAVFSTIISEGMLFLLYFYIVKRRIIKNF